MTPVRGMAALPAATAPPTGPAGLRRCPHAPQKAKAAPTVLPHLGQTTVSRAGAAAAGGGVPSLRGAGTIPGIDDGSVANVGTVAEGETTTGWDAAVARGGEGATRPPAAAAGPWPTSARGGLARVRGTGAAAAAA